MTHTIEQVRHALNVRLPFPLDNNRAALVLVSLIGSDSHGTKIPTEDGGISDVDYMVIVAPPIEYVYGLKTFDSLHFQAGDMDCVVYSLQKFYRLAAASNPNVFTLLWADSRFHLYQSALWTWLIAFREQFSSLAVYHPFIKYAESQFRKMGSFDIITQNAWDAALAIISAAGYTKEQIVANEHREMPNIMAVRKYLMKNWPWIDPEDALVVPPISDEIALTQISNSVDAIRSIHAKHFQGYMGEKRKALVRKFGYDTKNAAHLIRITRMCCEFLETGVMSVYRTHDAEELKAIKAGAWTLDAVKEEAQRLFARAEQAFQENPMHLPAKVDVDAVSRTLALYSSFHYQP